MSHQDQEGQNYSCTHWHGGLLVSGIDRLLRSKGVDASMSSMVEDCQGGGVGSLQCEGMVGHEAPSRSGIKGVRKG